MKGDERCRRSCARRTPRTHEDTQVSDAAGDARGELVRLPSLGHWGGYRLLVRYGRYVRLDQAKVKVARYLFLRHGGKVVFFGRFVSILRTYAAFLAGTTRMPWRRFLAFNAAGGIVWATLYGTAAYLLGKEVERLRRALAIGFGIAGADRHHHRRGGHPQAGAAPRGRR
jgi:hypothetical protein